MAFASQPQRQPEGVDGISRIRSCKRVRIALGALVILAATSNRVFAQSVDLTLFLGRAYPTFDERLRFAPSLPALPRVSVTEQGRLEIVAEGEAVFGAALGIDFGVLGIEGRFDATDMGVRVSGTRYELIATAPVITREGSITIGAGRLEADRFGLLSLNARIRTPGRVAFLASGGLSYLSGVNIEGSLPVAVELVNAPASRGNARLQLVAAPDEPEHRWGINGGAGLRIGGRHVALMAEARVFYFRDFELRFAALEGPDLLNAVVTGMSAVSFEPVLVNAQAGLVFRF